MAVHHVASSVSSDVTLYVEDSGEGVPILFIHEFAGDHRSWVPQTRLFSERNRCIAYAARGYPPHPCPRGPRHTPSSMQQEMPSMSWMR